jgi:hypothetical protein
VHPYIAVYLFPEDSSPPANNPDYCTAKVKETQRFRVLGTIACRVSEEDGFIRVSVCGKRAAARSAGQQFIPSLGSQKLRHLKLLQFRPHNHPCWVIRAQMGGSFKILSLGDERS